MWGKIEALCELHMQAAWILFTHNVSHYKLLVQCSFPWHMANWIAHSTTAQCEKHLQCVTYIVRSCFLMLYTTQMATHRTVIRTAVGAIATRNIIGWCFWFLWSGITERERERVMKICIGCHITLHKCLTLHKFSPLQFNPLSSSPYPVLQLQLKLPMVLVQLCSQPPFAVWHSLMSVEQQNIKISLCTNSCCFS